MHVVKLAGCIVRDERGRVLLLHRNTSELQQWEIPGGKVDPGEQAGDTAERELREEVGVEVAVGRELGTRSFTENGRTMEYTWFLADITAGRPHVVETHIHDNCGYHDLADLAAMEEQLSPNTRNLLRAISAGDIDL
ncbi:NUDIX hydrolase [Saccharothrix sp. NPDC042600]|uniref:NUDIX hydrolase n=1 Tax=Saccharothrix TaxID=2071 RepID=UPI00340FF3CA